MQEDGQHGMYDRQFEHDACGVGLVANLNNIASHDIVLNGRTVLKYHGIELIEAEVDSILADLTDMPESFVLLAPKKNLVFALNTAAMPDADVRMWYNADELENRQRACFLAGAEILDENLVVFASKAKA